MHLTKKRPQSSPMLIIQPQMQITLGYLHHTTTPCMSSSHSHAPTNNQLSPQPAKILIK